MTAGTVGPRRGGVFLPESRPDTPDPGDLPQWVANLQLQRLLCSAMFACIAWSLAQALRVAGLAPLHALALGLVAWLVFTIALALGGRAATRNLRRYSQYGLTDWILLLAPILVALKLLPRVLEGRAALAAEVASWATNPSRFFDVTLVWSFLLVFFVWDEALRNAEALALLSLQPGELPPSASTADYHDWMSSPYRFVNHTAAWRRLMWRFVAGGFVLLILTGIATVPTGALGNADRPEVGGFMPHVLLYYLLGLLLAGQTALDRLRTVWLRAGAVVQPGLARRWLGYGLALVGLSLVIALLLPTSFSDKTASIPVLSVLLFPLRLLFGGVNWLLSHIAALLLLPLTWLVPQGVAGSGGGAGGQAVPPPVLPEVPAAASSGPSLLTRIVFSILLYLLPSGLALYAIWNTWRKRRAIASGLRTFWQDVWQLLKGAVLDLAALLWRFFSFGSPRLLSLAPPALQARLQRLRRRGAGAGAAAGSGWLRLRSLGPRALIQYFYVSLAQRAEGVGWGRHQSQTPYEYSRQLAERLPAQRAEIDALTEAFVRARYSPRDVDASDARRARTPWERVRGALQTRRRTHQVASWLGLSRGS